MTGVADHCTDMGCNPVRKSGPVSMDHVLLALCETREECEARIQMLLNLFNSDGAGYLDYPQIEVGLSRQRILVEYKYTKDILKVVDANRDVRVKYQEFQRYMDDKELSCT